MPYFGKTYCYISKTIHSVRVFRHFLLWSRDIPNMGVVWNICSKRESNKHNKLWCSLDFRNPQKGGFEIPLATACSTPRNTGTRNTGTAEHHGTFQNSRKTWNTPEKPGTHPKNPEQLKKNQEHLQKNQEHPLENPERSKMKIRTMNWNNLKTQDTRISHTVALPFFGFFNETTLSWHLFSTS